MSRRLCALLLALAPLPALADISLPGKQHIGDDPCGSIAYVPCDPVSRAQMKANPTHFNLSASATVTAVQLVSPVDLNDKLQVFIDDMTTVLAGTRSGSCDNGGTCTYTLTTPIALSAGSHTIWPDGGCSSGTLYATTCSSGENDFSFSSINLVSTATNASRGIHRRYHLGDYPDESLSSATRYYSGTYYPDAPDGTSVAATFTVDVTRRLSEVRFWRSRDVNTNNPVLLDGVQIATLSTNGSPASLATSVPVTTGSHTLTVQSKIVSGSNYDDFSWDDIVLIFVNNPATTPGEFNAVDTGANAASGQIQTKIAGSAVTVDLVALSGGAPLVTYTGTHVSVELLDASNTTGVLVGGTNCDAGWTTVMTLGTNIAFVAIDAGRKPFPFTYAEALANARLKITDSDLAVTGCSTDNFAIRPSYFGNILVSHNDADTAGTAIALATSGFTATTTPVHHAGEPFTIRATAYNAADLVTANYSGSPTIDSVASSSLLGTNLGSASVSSWSSAGGTITSNVAKYLEAGAARLALVDTTFANVDADDTSQGNLEIGPSYVNVGRFVPDHFSFTPVVAANFVPGCAGGSTPFTYAGQPFKFEATPTAHITAVEAGGTTTANYDGTLYKLTVNPQSTYAAVAGTFDQTRVPIPNNTAVNQGSGVTLYTVVVPPPASGYAFTRGATPAVTFNADVTIVLSISETDGVDFGGARGFGTATVGNGIPFAVGGVSGLDYNQVRYGRLVIESAHGSERLPLRVPLRTEYFATVSGGTGFARNLLDDGTAAAGCTGNLLVKDDISISPQIVASTVTASALSAWTKGQAMLTLDAPLLAGANVTEEVNLTALISGKLPWLQVDNADVDTLWNNDPVGVATFGLFKNDERRIYQREVIGP